MNSINNEKTIFINNPFNCHFEIIESVLLNTQEIFNLRKFKLKIYLNILNNLSFTEYLKNKYPFIIFSKPDKFDFYINCTIYDWDYNNLKKNSNTHFYISHEWTPRLDKLNNVYFLFPKSRNFIRCNSLPFTDNKIKSEMPIYIVQGGIAPYRRNYQILLKILEETKECRDYKIKFIGRGKLPPILEKYKHKIILKLNKNFQDFHREFLDGYCILPLISKKSQPHYYINKCTSTMNYASGYNLKCLIDKELQSIWNLKNVEVYEDINDIVSKFKKTLEDFYKN